MVLFWVLSIIWHLVFVQDPKRTKILISTHTCVSAWLLEQTLVQDKGSLRVQRYAKRGYAVFPQSSLPPNMQYR